MIVRNEEKSISRCLGSVKDFVGEIVVVDTGCGDQTLEIAQAFGAKIFHHPWTGDFSESRNYSIDQAKGEWILILDADEQLARRDSIQLANLIKSHQYLGYSLIQRSYLWDATVACSKPNPGNYSEGAEFSNCVDVSVIRLFRNLPSIRYCGRVHELLEPVFDKKDLPCLPTSLVMHHYGKVGDRARLESKMRLYLDLGRKKIADEPGNAMAHFELGSQLFEICEHAESIPCFEIAYQLNPKLNISLLYLAIAHHFLGNVDRAGHYYEQCLAMASDNERVLFEYANFERDKGNLKRALKFYQKSVALNPQNAFSYFNMGGVYLRLGKIENGFKQLRRAVELNPNSEAIHEKFGRLALKGVYLEEAAGLIEAFLRRFSQSAPCSVVMAQISFKLKRFEKTLEWVARAQALGAVENSLLLIKAHSEFSLGHLAQAEEAYRAFLERDATHQDCMMNLVAISERRGDTETMKTWLSKTLEHYPDHPAAVRKYGMLMARKHPDEKALELLKRAYRANPGDVECLLLLGHLLEKNGRPEEALELYQQVQQEIPKLARLAGEKIYRLESVIGASARSMTQL